MKKGKYSYIFINIKVNLPAALLRKSFFFPTYNTDDYRGC